MESLFSFGLRLDAMKDDRTIVSLLYGKLHWYLHNYDSRWEESFAMDKTCVPYTFYK